LAIGKLFRYKRAYGDARPFYGARRAEIDFSKTLLASLVWVFNKTTTSTYFEGLWSIAIGTAVRREKEMLFPIHICRFHVLRYEIHAPYSYNYFIIYDIFPGS
jgi:hypothetical protein